MELDDLKSLWKSVEPHMGMVSPEDSDKCAMRHQADIKTRLMRRTLISLMITIIGGGITVSSRIWAPVLFPASWLVSFGVCAFAGAMAEVYLLILIRNINLWEMSLLEVFDVTLRIKRYYKRIELAFSVLFGILIGWLSFLPPFAGNWRMALIWIVLAVAMLTEYLWYMKNISLINRLADTE